MPKNIVKPMQQYQKEKKVCWEHLLDDKIVKF